MDRPITLVVNGRQKRINTDAQRPLLEVLREDFHLHGVKYGCGEGWCGACTVLMDGKRTLSCRTPAARADGKSVTTIEGLAAGDQLHPVQAAFAEAGAAQCGYCTPGMILTAVALLKEKPQPTEQEIVEGMDGNLCRCCNYTKIIQAVKLAAELARR